MNTIQSISPASDEERQKTRSRISIAFATLEDVDALVALHYMCFTEKDHIALKFGRRFIFSVYRWFVTSPETFVIVAKQGNDLIGFQSVSDRPYDVPMLLANWRAAAFGLLFRPWLIFHPELLRRLLYSLLPREKKSSIGHKVAQLAFIGVNPKTRGMGVGKALINATIAACRQRGMNAIITGVKKGNEKSMALLEGSGLVIAPELETKRFIYLKMSLAHDEKYPQEFSQMDFEPGDYLQSPD